MKFERIFKESGHWVVIMVRQDRATYWFNAPSLFGVMKDLIVNWSNEDRFVGY